MAPNIWNEQSKASGRNSEEIDNKKIEMATQTLDRNIGFISSCDNKSSIVLATIGVLVSIVLTNEGLKTISTICNTCVEKNSFGSVFYLVLWAMSAVSLAWGVLNLLGVLVAHTNAKAKGLNDFDSHIFFSGIVKCKDCKAFQKQFISMNQKDYLDELLSEIYINAEIAEKKYKKYNRGLNYTVIGFLAFFILYVVGIYLF